MTDVMFHFNVAERLPYVCRLLRKAHRMNTPLSVFGDGATLDRLDRLLWVFDALEFVPHVRPGAQGTVADHLVDTPIWLVDQVDHAPAGHQVLVLLADDVPTGVERFERLIEVVSVEPHEIQAGRMRWRAHSDAGRRIVRHDAASSGGAPADGG
jgi:DNA polymerase III subunit chi